MGYGYNNGNRRRYNANGYRPSSYGRKKRNRRRLKNRIIIVSAGIVILALIIIFLTSFFNCVCSACGNDKENTLDTATTAATKETKPVKETTAREGLTFNEPNIDDDEDSEGVNTDSLYVWNKTAFELFYGSDSQAETYAKTINSLSKSLGSGINVYNMIIPNHTEMGLPSRLKNTEGGAITNSQANYIKTAYSKLDDSVTIVNPYNELSKHCNEYIYFDSDHHWTGLGAYYAYTAFTDATNKKAISLEDCTENIIEGFTGTFTQMTDEKLTTDKVHYWTFPYTVTDEVTDGNGTVNEYDGCYYKYASSGTLTYGVFLYGDNPLEVLKSECETAKDEKIAIVHESYGNALVPYFTYNYKEVYSIDFRSWNGNLKSFCKENNIKNVLFVNGVMSSATALQIQAMEGLK